MGIEGELTDDFLLCMQGKANQASNSYLEKYDGVTLPGYTKDGRSGASVNHTTLAGGIALFKEPNLQSVIDWWDLVAADWKKNGAWFIEDGTRNTYWQWIMAPCLEAAEKGATSLDGINESIWARMALGASSKSGKYGNSSSKPQPEYGLDTNSGTWCGYATTFCGARSWKYNAPHWSHQEKTVLDWALHWAVNNNLSEAPGNNWFRDCIDAGLKHRLSSTQRTLLKNIIEDRFDDDDIADVLDMLNGCTTHNEYSIVRTEKGVFTMFYKSFNGNTQFMYGVSFDHSSQWNQWLGHGNGTRNVKQGTAWPRPSEFEGACESNDGSESSVFDLSEGKVLVHVKVDQKGGKFYRADTENAEPPPNPDPDPDPDPEPLPPEDDALTDSERTYYADEIRQMANRQNQLADQLASTKTYSSDVDVAQQLGHQSRKAARLSREIAAILEFPTQTKNETTAEV